MFYAWKNVSIFVLIAPNYLHLSVGKTEIRASSLLSTFNNRLCVQKNEKIFVVDKIQYKN